MKPFTIRKATKAGAPLNESALDQSLKYGSTAGASRGKDGLSSSMKEEIELDPNSNLTAEDLDKIVPEKKRVINHWIHQQTHQEYLKNITVSKSPVNNLNLLAPSNI